MGLMMMTKKTPVDSIARLVVVDPLLQWVAERNMVNSVNARA
jgi:hypothetical protein